MAVTMTLIPPPPLKMLATRTAVVAPMWMWLPRGAAMEEEEEWAIGENSGEETGIVANRRPTETRERLLLTGCLEPR